MVKDETGNKYGRLTVISRGENDKQGNAMWYCKCDCGNPNLYLARGYGLEMGILKVVDAFMQKLRENKELLIKKLINMT